MAKLRTFCRRGGETVWYEILGYAPMLLDERPRRHILHAVLWDGAGLSSSPINLLHDVRRATSAPTFGGPLQP